jgi:nicotinate-nucleotide adenylyltransferase
MAIGLFGGSFDPAHEGHRLVSDTALRRLRLDRIWWIVTPGNPLKDRAGRPPQGERMAAAAAMLDDPRVAVTGFERLVGSTYTADMLAFLLARRPGVDFVWIMGADNLRQLPRWRRWRFIASALPLAVIDRPGATLTGPLGLAARALAPWRAPEEAAARLPRRAAPAWTLLHGPRSGLSSSRLRARGGPTALKTT